jgi:hypothetical protein
VRGSVLRLGLLGALLAADRAVAQAVPRFTLQVREVAAAGRTDRAGWIPVDASSAPIYVPTRCVGTRCPLLLIAAGHPGAQWWVPGADKYGFIVSTTTAEENTESRLKQILLRVAIDPDKIAIMGQCATVSHADRIAVHNLHVFRRIIRVSGGGTIGPSWGGLDTLPNAKVEFFMSDGILEGANTAPSAENLQRAGYPVKHVASLRPHVNQWESFEAVSRWLAESWAIPDPTARPMPERIPAAPLTADALPRMTAFWTRFLQEPDSIRIDARRAHQREVLIPIAQWTVPTSALLTDIAALAARYPSVAAALQEMGLTAQQHEAYRVAIISAYIARRWGLGAAQGESLRQLMRTYPDEFQALQATQLMQPWSWHKLQP